MRQHRATKQQARAIPEFTVYEYEVIAEDAEGNWHLTVWTVRTTVAPPLADIMFASQSATDRAATMMLSAGLEIVSIKRIVRSDHECYVRPPSLPAITAARDRVRQALRLHPGGRV